MQMLKKHNSMIVRVLTNVSNFMRLDILNYSYMNIVDYNFTIFMLSFCKHRR